MKKRIIIIIILGLTAFSTVRAQFYIGPGVIYGTNIESAGISGNLSVDLPLRFGLMGSYSYFFDKVYYPDGSNPNWWALDFDVTHALPVIKYFYFLAGVNLIYYKYPTTLGDMVGTINNKTGGNIGAGFRLGLSRKIKLVPEVRYTIGDFNYLRYGIKLMFGL